MTALDVHRDTRVTLACPPWTQPVSAAHADEVWIAQTRLSGISLGGAEDSAHLVDQPQWGN